jgi:flagellar export protein FliJ
MNQLLGLMQRVEQDIQTVQLQQSQTRQRLLEAERERMKMTSLAEQDARNVQINLNKREQRQIDALGLSRFNQRDVH